MFQSAGMENPKLGTVIVGILKIVFTIITIFIMNRFRRKLLMQISLGIDSKKYLKTIQNIPKNISGRQFS